MNFVDEENRVIALAEIRKEPLETLLKVTAVFRAGKQRAEIEGVNHCLLERLRYLTIDNHLGKALGNGGFTDAGFANQQRVVLATSREDLCDTLHLGQTPDEWVDIASLGLGVEVSRVGIERPLFCTLVILLRISERLCAIGRFFPVLPDAMGNEVHHIETGHVL